MLQPGWKLVGEGMNEHKEPHGMSSSQVEAALGNPMNLQWVDVSKHHISDVSGRTPSKIIASPGGDIVEFINALNVFSELSGEPLENVDCQLYLEEFLKSSKKASIYLTTDVDQVQAIANALDIGNLDLTATPSDSVKDKLLNMLTDSANQGCLTLRMILLGPDRFRIRAAKATTIPACAIRAFFNLLWDKKNDVSSKMRLVELEGESKERAILNVYSPLPCEAQGIMPLITPTSDKVCDSNSCNQQMMVIHPLAATVMHAELADYFATKSDKVDQDGMVEHLKRNTERFVDLIVATAMRPTDRIQLPVYEVKYD
eukprot:c15294_g1_i1.p1 GENE.c15294_g1_i1~~c15294_g1_i1.p1  ORF type:complete len:315 (+),score=52.11 c15294_g1_i1:397-1341(+)